MTTKKSAKKTTKKVSPAVAKKLGAQAKKDVAKATRSVAKAVKAKASVKRTSHGAKNEARKAHQRQPSFRDDLIGFRPPAAAHQRQPSFGDEFIGMPPLTVTRPAVRDPAADRPEDRLMDSLMRGPAKSIGDALKTDVRRSARRPLTEKVVERFAADALLMLLRSEVLKIEGGKMWVRKQDGSGYVIIPPKDRIPTAILRHRQILLNEEIERRVAEGEEIPDPYQPHDTMTAHSFGRYPGRQHSLGA